MDVSALIQIVGSLGFPTAACVAVFWYLMRESENHKEEVNKLSEALQNNTIALTKLCDELEEYGEKKLDAGSLDVIDKLAHTIKNLDKIIEKYEENEYSERYAMEGGSYQRGGNRGGQGNRGGYSREMAYDDGMMNGSYARGRGRNVKRDSMGRYSREDGYSERENSHRGTGTYSYGSSKEEMLEKIEEMKREIQQM